MGFVVQPQCTSDKEVESLRLGNIIKPYEVLDAQLTGGYNSDKPCIDKSGTMQIDIIGVGSSQMTRQEP